MKLKQDMKGMTKPILVLSPSSGRRKPTQDGVGQDKANGMCNIFVITNYSTVQVIEISMFREPILIISQKLNNKQKRKIMLKFGNKNYNRETDSVVQLEGGTHVLKKFLRDWLLSKILNTKQTRHDLCFQNEKWHL